MTATILVIDDNTRIATTIRQAAAGQDWTILDAKDGLVGLTLIRQHHHELRLVILDIHMPGLSGKEVLIQIRSQYPDLPILPVTGDATAVDFLDSMGCAPTIVKPVRPVTLVEGITAAMNQPPSPIDQLPQLQVLLEYTKGLVSEKERTLRERSLEPGPGQIVICTSFDTERAGQKDIATQVGNVIVACPPQNLDMTLHRIDLVHAILTVAADVDKVAPAAQTFNIPLIVSTRQLLEGILLAMDERVQGIVLEHPQDPNLVVRMLATAMTEVMAGERYIPSVIRRPFSNTSLSEREYQVIMLELQGTYHKDIPAILHTSHQTVYTQRRSAFDKLGLVRHEEGIGLTQLTVCAPFLLAESQQGWHWDRRESAESPDE